MFLKNLDPTRYSRHGCNPCTTVKAEGGLIGFKATLSYIARNCLGRGREEKEMKDEEEEEQMEGKGKGKRKKKEKSPI